jgi:GNAT superfamily N-acetyltransferase
VAAADEVRLEIVGPATIADCGIGCVMDTAHPGFQPKVDWLRQRFDEGLRYLLCRDRADKPLGFLEYVPGENAWRPVDAAGWLFVHCLWVYPRGRKHPGLGTRLIRACLDEARRLDMRGVAAMVSEGPWMAGRRVFLRNGFAPVAAADRFELVACRQKRGGDDPRFRDVGSQLAEYRGLHVLYAPQCPYLPKSAADLAAVAAEHGLELGVTVLDTAAKAQCAPSYYGVFNLIRDGRLLADHYVSKARFRNILRKEIAARDG